MYKPLKEYCPLEEQDKHIMIKNILPLLLVRLLLGLALLLVRFLLLILG